MNLSMPNNHPPFHSNFVRLGHRNYVQGSTLVQGLIEAIASWNLGALQHLNMACYSMLNEQGCYELIKHEQMDNNNIKKSATVFKIRCNSVEHLVLLNGTQKEVTTVIPYDEEVLISQHTLLPSEKKITYSWNANHPLMMILIALNKALLHEVLASNVHGKWIFYKCDLNWHALHSETGTLSLQLGNNLGLQSACSNIYLNETKVGNIFFSRPVL
ncbi:hypothetical protein [Legionella oakridgensis]|uniref:Uncharacterized protein n=1 Tax=Legionella oakridgensis TaxID=29423 RepID=A0A0W0WXH2_9GAMM|nr:hypothetical protein [Legionella oakridgensis]ETO92866.1 hypothetical protein LOR_61c15200 [Legionella oakridgensis RV-2-2007]KTD37027.1 hypothetical protein Loak_2163 [Legionella oakridgensis]STY20664.1 Uncharacterised protein [Legionella longbeachae]